MSDAKTEQAQQENADPRPALLREMLLQLQQWIDSIPDDAVIQAMGTSKILLHQTAVNMWLTQLEQFGAMVSHDQGARERVTTLAHQVQGIGTRLYAEIDARVPARG